MAIRLLSAPAVKVFATAAEPIHTYTKGLGNQKQLTIADMALVIFNAGDDKGRHFHTQQVDFP